MMALVLTYHAVGDGRGPLFVSPELFAAHLDTIRSSGAKVLTIGGLGNALRQGALPERAVAITFDDGFASVARVAAPLLLERGLTATVFCVAGHLGGTNDWPSQPRGIPRLPLATAAELSELSRAGFELGAHGFEHAPLLGEDMDFLNREVVDARTVLEDAVGETVNTFAYPYGTSSPRAAALARETYDAACTAQLSLVKARGDAWALPRVDAHYLRRPDLLRRALRNKLDAYLSARSLGARARRALHRDYLRVDTGGAR